MFYLNEWSSKQGALVANFVARDILDVINESTYKKSTFGSMTMYDLAEDILVDAGVTSYSIDSALSSISTIGCQGVLTHRDALQTIAIASRSVLYQDRSGVVHIKQLSDTPLDYTLGLNVSYQSPDISLEKLYNVINVQIKTFTDQPSQVIGTGTFTLTGATTVWIDYSTMPAKRTSTSITNGTINSATYYGNGASLNITPSGTVTVEITGTPVSITDTTYTLDNSQQGEQKYSITIDNLLITNSSLASDVALWVYNQYQKRLKYTSSWIQNPALESGDTILVENLFTTPREATVTKSVLNYQGYLTGTTESRGK